MTEKTTFGDLRRLLEDFGFDQIPANGPYVVFKHDASGALQAFRAHRAPERVDPMTLASVRKTLLGFGFLEEDEFEGAVRGAAARTGKAKRR